MITAIRHGIRLQIARNTNNHLSRQIFSGFSGSLKCVLSCRTLYDSVNKRALEARSKLKPTKILTNPICPPPKSKKIVTNKTNLKPNKNLEVLRAQYCHPAKITDAYDKKKNPTSKEDETPQDSKFKYWLAFLALGGIAGFIYYIKSGKDSSRKQSPETISTAPVRLKIPPSSADIPKSVPYLLIGGGTASFSAFRAIKSHSPKAKVLVITNEYEKPYMRPPLSKELWYHGKPGAVSKDYKFEQWNGAQRSLFYEPEEFYIDPTKLMDNPNGGVAIVHGYTVKKIDVCERKAILTDGTEIEYGECLLATGCSPKLTEAFESASLSAKEKISTFRTTEDFELLKKVIDTEKNVAVIGSGFLGSELSCALAKYGEDRGVKIYQIFYESGNMAKVLPEYLSKWTTQQVEQQGVNVLQNSQVTAVDMHNNQLKLTLSNGKIVLTDHVVVCAGCEPNTEIANTSDLETNSHLGGFVVNAELEARRHLFVAGDAACFYDPLLGRRRVEHHDHSVISGRLAGENMVGLKKPFAHQSMFWSDLGPKLGYEGIGLVDSTLPTVGVFAKLSPNDSKTSKDEKTDTSTKTINKTNNTGSSDTVTSVKCNDDDDYGKGVIFYLKDDKIVGVLLWNLFNRISIARKLINENKKFDDFNEVAKLFEIHS